MTGLLLGVLLIGGARAQDMKPEGFSGVTLGLGRAAFTDEGLKGTAAIGAVGAFAHAGPIYLRGTLLELEVIPNGDMMPIFLRMGGAAGLYSTSGVYVAGGASWGGKGFFFSAHPALSGLVGFMAPEGIDVGVRYRRMFAVADTARTGSVTVVSLEVSWLVE